MITTNTALMDCICERLRITRDVPALAEYLDGCNADTLRLAFDRYDILDASAYLAECRRIVETETEKKP